MENPFDVIIHKEDRPINAKQFVLDEMLKNITEFSPITQLVIGKIQNQEKKSIEEWNVYKYERDEWWMKRFGFSYNDLRRRIELLSKINSPKIIKEERTALLWDFLDALKDGDEERVKDLKDVFYSRFPDQLEGVTVLFEMLPFLQLSTEVGEDREYFHEQKKHYEFLTQYQFLLTDFVIQNSDDADFMENFWEVFKKVAEDAGLLNSYDINKRGILSQVAIFKTLEELGYTPELSHPKEDAFNAIDVWIEADKPLQVKSSKNKEAVMVVNTDKIAFPGIVVDQNGVEKHINSHMMHKVQRFLARLNEYDEFIEKDMVGYFIVIPESMFDDKTGEPDADFVKLVRAELGM